MMGKGFVVLIFFLCAFLVFCGVSNLVTLKFFDVTSGTLSLLTGVVDFATAPFDWVFRSQFLPERDETGFRDSDVIVVTRFVFYKNYDGATLETPVVIDCVLKNALDNRVLYSTDPLVRKVAKTVFGKYWFYSAYVDVNGAEHQDAVLYAEEPFQDSNIIGVTDEITYQFYKHQVKDNPDYFN